MALTRVQSKSAAVPRPAADVDLLDALLHVMLRLMMQAAATAVCVSTADSFMLTASLLERVDGSRPDNEPS